MRQDLDRPVTTEETGKWHWSPENTINPWDLYLNPVK